MVFQHKDALRLVVGALFVTYTSAFFCIDFEDLPASQTREVFLKVSSSDCLNPVSGVEVSQFCITFGRFDRTIGTVELVPHGPGIYKYTAPPYRHVIIVKRKGFLTRYLVIPRGNSDISVDVQLRCRGGRRCTADWYELKVNNLCSSTDAEPLAFAHHALSTRETSSGVFRFEFCSVPQQATVVVGDHVESVAITQPTQQVDITCGACPTFELTLTSECDPGTVVSGATLSLLNSETRPGTYLVQVCNGSTSLTVQKFGFQSVVITVPDPLTATTVTMECTETLTMVKHPQSKWRMVNSDVKLCCEAVAYPGVETIAYQWYKNGAIIAGETANEIALSNLQTTNSGEYVCKARIASQNIEVASNKATLTVTADDLTTVITKNVNICGRLYSVGQCRNVPCSVSGNQACLDDGMILPKDTIPLTSSCGVVYTRVQSCECQVIPDITVDVTVRDADTLQLLEDITVVVQGTSLTGETDASGVTSLVLPAGTSSAVLKASDATAAYLDTIKVLENIVGSEISVSILMFSKPGAISVDPAVATTLSLSNTPQQASGPVKLNIKPNSFFGANGAPVSGRVDVFFKAVPPTTDIVDKAPGVFKAVDGSGDLTELQTAGVFTLSAADSNGNSVASLPIQIEAQFGYKLWVLNDAGSWDLVPMTTRRRRRRQTTNQTSVYEFIGEVGINTEGIRWYNIDKFPENTRCWFKSKIYDVSTGAPVIEDGSTQYRALVVAHTSAPSIFPLTRYTTSPSTSCFEIRCDSASEPGVPLGYIALEATYVTGITERATPYSLTDYIGASQTAMAGLGYTVLTSPAPDFKQSISMNLVSDVNGPFFTSQSVCEAAGSAAADDDNVLRFRLNPPELSDPYENSTNRCVGRVLLDNPWFNGGNTTTEQPSRRKRQAVDYNYYAVSRWGNNSDEYYIYSDTFTEDNSTGEIVFCLEYRCSQPDDLTTVTINLDNYYGRLKYYCNMTFVPTVVSSTGSGYFLNTNSDVSAAINECETDTSTDFAYEVTCNNGGDRKFLA